MNDQLRDRISKIYELIQRGSTAGERQAAEKALNRLMKKYNLSEDQINSIDRREYSFTYTSLIEEKLMIAILNYFLDDFEEVLDTAYKTNYDEKALKRCKQFRIKLKYVEWITIDSAYEYFRRHMKSQWNKHCQPTINRCRKHKTKNSKRRELQRPFIVNYLYKSGLLSDSDVNTRPIKSQSELQVNGIINGVEGGTYNTQVQTAHMLPENSDVINSSQTKGQLQIFQNA